MVCADLVHDDVGDTTALPGLLDQLDAPASRFPADGAYDGASTRDLLRQRHGEAIDVVIPPPKNAVISPQSAHDPSVRDRRIARIHLNGCMGGVPHERAPYAETGRFRPGQSRIRPLQQCKWSDPRRFTPSERTGHYCIDARCGGLDGVPCRVRVGRRSLRLSVPEQLPDHGQALAER